MVTVIRTATPPTLIPPEELISQISTHTAISEDTLALTQTDTPTPLPLQDSALTRAQSYLRGFNLIIENSSLEDTDKAALIKRAQGQQEELIGNMKTLQLETPLTQKNLAAINQLQQYFYQYLAAILAEATQEYLGTADKWLADADVLINWKRRPSQCTSYEQGNHTVVMIEAPVYHFTQALTDEYLAIIKKDAQTLPAWFTQLPPWEQAALRTKVSEAANSVINFDPTHETSRNAFAAALGTLPSTIRKYPGIANFSKHTQIIFDSARHVVAQNEILRAATPPPYQVKNKKEKLRLLSQNLEQFQALTLDSDKTSLVTGLVSPIAGLEFNISKQITQHTHSIDKYGASPILYSNRALSFRIFTRGIKKDDTSRLVLKNALSSLTALLKLPHSLRAGLPDLENIFHQWNVTNDFNTFKADMMRWQNAYRTRYNAPSSSLRQKKHYANILLRLNALTDYVELLHKKPNVRNDRNPNLFVNVLEQLLIDHAISGCKSGKDRGGLLLDHHDAMLEQFYLNGLRLPNYYDEGVARAQYNQCFAHIFLTHHQTTNSNFNAAGANGLKSLSTVLPKDTRAAITRLSGIAPKQGVATIFDQHKSAASRNRQTSALLKKIARFFVVIGLKFRAFIHRLRTKPHKAMPSATPTRSSSSVGECAVLPLPPDLAAKAKLRKEHIELLTQRGVPPAEASALVNRVFVSPIAPEILDKQIRDAIRDTPDRDKAVEVYTRNSQPPPKPKI